jgi:hypothetical protein
MRDMAKRRFQQASVVDPALLSVDATRLNHDVQIAARQHTARVGPNDPQRSDLDALTHLLSRHMTRGNQSLCELVVVLNIKVA